VLLNILSNAVKFTEAPGSITMSVERTAVFEDQTTLSFCIRDTGIGMDQAFVPKVFDAFSQEDGSYTTKYGSTGLGMAITKSIVELMNGTISVESEKGAGTEFTVVVTLTNGESAYAAENAGDAAGKTGGAAELKGRHILMAEDVIVNAEIMKKIIETSEAEIDHAENGSIALDMFKNSEPGYYDAILMDIRMPAMDGLETTEAIRALDRPDAKTVPIIAMTANAFDEDVQRSLQVGMNAHLSKPVEPDKLYRTLEELIGKRNASDAE
jgi:CheY-like chemotaxis protein